MELYEFRQLLKTNVDEAISLWNEQFEKGLDTTNAGKEIGFSWTSISKELLALGYHKPKNKLICKIGEEGEAIMNNKETKLKLTDEEILYIKDIYKNRTLKETKEDLVVRGFDDYKQRSMLISEELLNELDVIYKEYKQYKKQDIFNEILKKGIENFKN